MKSAIARLVITLIGLGLYVASLVNSVKIQADPALAPKDRETAMILLSIVPLVAGSLFIATGFMWDRIVARFGSVATTAKNPVTFEFSDPVRGVDLKITLTETEKSADDTEGRKKIGDVLRHYGSGGAA